MQHCGFDTPLGRLQLSERDGRLVAIDWRPEAADGEETPLLKTAKVQLSEYFARARHAFDLPLDPGGSPFQRRVWQALCAIPYGETRRYGELAADLDGIARAVGTACGDNPLPIVIPCHRVLAQDGMGGFSAPGGLETKAALLRLEGALLL